MPALVWLSVFGFAAGESRTLDGFRRSYKATAGETVSPGGFHRRLTPTFAGYLCEFVERGIDEVAVPDAVGVDVDRFRDAMIADGTALLLHRLLSEEFEPRRGKQGGARLHLFHNVTEQTINGFSVTNEKAHDSTEFSSGSWLEDRLLLFIRAYFKYRRFALMRTTVTL